MGDPKNYAKYLSPWLAERDPMRLIAMGKLQEELGECSAALGRCVIQGFDGVEPETRVPNRDWLTDEIADVLAAIDRVVWRFDLDRARIADRQQAKAQHFRRWDDLAREHFREQA